MKEKTMVLIISALFGLVWGIIYLIFSLMHSMSEMFNNQFIFLIANVFNIKVETILEGFIYSFIDGALMGLIVGVLFIKVKRSVIEKINIEEKQKHL